MAYIHNLQLRFKGKFHLTRLKDAMGVRGLWKVLEATGRPIPSPEALSGQRVAIDASIWIYQFLRALPPSGSYHSLVLAGLFRRVCKLLYFGIKPVMVFDGAAPRLKQDVTRDRAMKRGASEERFRRVARKIIALQLHLDSLEGKERVIKKDTFEGLEDEGQTDDLLGDDEEFFFTGYEEGADDDDDSGISQIDVDSTHFKRLPVDVQQEILLAKKEYILRQHLNVVRKDENHIHALDFSKLQVDALVKRRRIAERLEQVQDSLPMEFEGEYVAGVVEDRGIAAEHGRRYRLVRNTPTEGGGWTFDEVTEASSKAIKPKENNKNDPEDDFESLFGVAVEKDQKTNEIVLGSLMESIKRPTSTTETGLSFNPDTYLQKEKKEALPIQVVDLKDEREQGYPIIKSGLPSEGTLEKAASIENERVPRERVPCERVPCERVSEHSISSSSYVAPTSESTPESSISETESNTGEDDANLVTEIINTKNESADNSELIAKLQSELTRLRESAPSLHSSAPDSELLTDFRSMLSIMGIPWIIAPSEAEAQCAHLQTNGHVDAILTDDNDTLLFGANKMYRHFYSTSKRIMRFGITDVERDLSLSRLDLITLSILLGSDYSVGVRGIGPIKGLQLLRILKPFISETISALSLIKMGLIEGDWPATGDSASDQFLKRLTMQCVVVDPSILDSAVLDAYLHPNVDTDKPAFRWSTSLPDISKLTSFLLNKLRWSTEQVRQTLDPIILRQTRK